MILSQTFLFAEISVLAMMSYQHINYQFEPPQLFFSKKGKQEGPSPVCEAANLGEDFVVFVSCYCYSGKVKCYPNF